MDVLFDHVMDMGLMVVGYAVAGLLGALIYSAVAHRRTAPAKRRAAAQSAASARAQAVAGPGSGREQFQFVDFRRTDAMSAHSDLAGAVSRVPSTTSTRRDRAEIIRLAREMLKARTPQETIKRTLPISDGELALLQNGNN